VSDASPFKILVVDDDDGNRYFKVHVLRDAGYRVGEASRGEESLRQVAAELPDLVVLDVRLPDMSGFEVCREIKAKHPGLLVLQTSAALTGTRDRTTGLEGGADSYLVEPLEPDELTAVVRALLRLRRVEQELRALNDTLEERVAERTRELAEAHRRIAREMAERSKVEEVLRHAEKLDALGHVTGGVAHDFNNLLTVVIGNLELIEQAVGATPPPPLGGLVGLVRSARRAALGCEDLTSKLLAFARRDTLRAEVINLNPIISRFVPLLQRALGERVAIDVSLHDALWACRVDVKQFESALLNVMVNARDAMPLGGPIVITTSNLDFASPEGAAGAGGFPAAEMPPGAYVQVSVTDRGTGMSDDVLAHAFDPFFTTKDIGQGTGLGLSQVHGFIKQSGGYIAIESALGRGTRVSLFLPRASAAPVYATKEAAPVGDLPRGHETILIVEDNESVLEVAVTVLVDLGYRVVTATDGKSALAVIRREAAIDLLFTDVVMPNRMSGVELARAAQRLKPALKVLMTSGYSAHHAGMVPGLDEFPAITKPYRRADLARSIRAVLDGSRYGG
jgi:signal transduction histidine kinase